MPKISANVLEAVGNTPLVRLNRVTAGISATVCAKLEASNPGRSGKDRIGLAVVEDAERRGLLKPGGTAGTISGTAKYLKERNPQCTVVGVDPEGSILAKAFKREPWSWSDSHPYKVEGIGEDFVPKNLLFQYIDEVVTVSDRDSFLMG